jgi:diguanylate cyclase (GGDEF)-like protein
MRAIEQSNNEIKNGFNIFYLVTYSSVVFLLLNVFFYQLHESFDYFAFIANAILLFTTYYLIFITQKNSINKSGFYYFTSIGFAFIFYGLYILTLNTLYLYQEAIVNISVKLLFVFGYSLLAIGVTKWIKYNETRKDELSIQANTDELTGLLNRRSFTSFINFEFNNSQRSTRPFSLVIVDIDYFKSINDKHGHLVGDEVLIELSEMFSRSFRRSDKVSRWGGEEFAILLPDTKLDNAMKVANNLRTKVENYLFNLSSVQIKITISGGVTESIASDEQVDDIIKRADEALYLAKNKRNSIRSIKA